MFLVFGWVDGLVPTDGFAGLVDGLADGFAGRVAGLVPVRFTPFALFL